MQAQLIRTYRGHGDRINHILHLPNNHMVTASADGTLKVWGLDADEPLLTMAEHRGAIYALASFAESAFVVSGSADHTLIIWNTETGEAVRTLCHHSDAVTSVAVTPDGKHIISGSEDKTICIWDSVTGDLKHVCGGHESGVYTLLVTPDSHTVISGETGGARASYRFRVWDIATGEHLRDFSEHHYGVNGVALLGDGKFISASTEGDLKIWDIAQGISVQTVETHLGSTVMALIPNTRHAVIGTQKPQISLWNIDSGERVYILDEPSAWVSYLTVTADGWRILVGCHDGTMNVYELVQ
jgi:WD40 repeat protein